MSLAVCVFCGSRPGDSPAFVQSARDLGAGLGALGWKLVYGGGDVGLMGVIADSALQAGAEVIGVIPQRLLDREVDEEISLGDFVLSGGELPAMVLLDAIVRQLPGALNTAGSAQEDSFVDGLLDCPHYTRPEVYQGERVPEVLLSGNHAVIRRWRLKQALGNSWLRRPDLLAGRTLSKTELSLLEEFKREQAGVDGGKAD